MMKHLFVLTVSLVIVALAPELARSQVEPTVGLIRHEPGAFEGYTLFAPHFWPTIYLIDNNGNAVHNWESEYLPGASVYLLENGALLCTRKTVFVPFAGGGGRLEEVDWDGNVLWQFDNPPGYYMHHDIEPMPNGNTLCIAWEIKSSTEAIAAGRDPANIPEGEIWPETILEVNRDKEIVWEWHVWDHLSCDRPGDWVANGRPVSQDLKDPGRFNINFVAAARKANWLHINSIDYSPDLDQIVLSCLRSGEFFIIDHSTCNYANPPEGIEAAAGPAGDFLYRWGNPEVYGMGTRQDRKFFGQHDAQWILPGLPGAGDILLFNNGKRRPGNPPYSSVEVVVPPLLPDGSYAREPDQPFGPLEQEWIYTAENPSDMYSESLSGAQRLPNGNTLICCGTPGRLIEITPEEEIAWLYINPVSNSGPQPQGNPISGNQVFRGHRFAPDFPGFAGRDLSPLGPIELPPTDLDEDGVPDLLEARHPSTDQTNIYLADSDGDGLSDGVEDADRDGSWDSGSETNPRSRDTDGDHYEDGIESRMSADPLDPGVPPAPFEDADGDALPDSLDPNDSEMDTDGDRISDCCEFVLLGDGAAEDNQIMPSLGDVNDDQTIDNADAQGTLLFFAYRVEGYFEPDHSDVNRDAAIDNADAQFTLNYFAAIQPYLPAR
jgi:hypothetical protein